MRRTLTKIAAAVALLVPAAAHADPVTLITLATLATIAIDVLIVALPYLAVASSVYGGMDARRRARNAQGDARRAYNASLSDRSVTAVRDTPSWRVVYGEAITGGDVVAILTSDKPTIGANGASTVKPDGLKHLVIAFASHEVEALGDVFVAGVSVGALDGAGWSTDDNWSTGQATRTAEVTFTGSTTLPNAALSIISAVSVVTGLYDAGTETWQRSVAISGAGLTLTATDGLTEPVTVVYTVSLSPAVIRISKHLGSDSQTVDSYLNGTKPTEWDSSHRLRGVAYLVVTMDLEDARFQGGPPPITCKVKGRKVYDPRTTLTAWSDNPALCVRDFIVAEYGMQCASADVIDATTIAAANACDVAITTSTGGVTAADVTYRCNGGFTAANGREATLDALCDSMAGFAPYGAQYQILAGAWSAPVMSLTDDDLDGQVEIVQAGAGIDELFNGVRGTYIAADASSPTDFEPYSNAAFVTADGEELWQDTALPFTNSKPHCSNIARVMTERARNSLVIRFPAKLRAWPLQIGDRVTVTSAEYGYSAKTFRVTDWQFGITAPVDLLLQEDAADAYDLVDAVAADPTPNTNLPLPWLVEAVTLGTPASGTAHLLRSGDGTIISRVWVSWAALTGAYLVDGTGRVVVRWKRVGADSGWREVSSDARELGAYIVGASDGDVVAIEAYAINSAGYRGALATASHAVVGKTAPPSDPTGFTGAANGDRITWTWNPIADTDYSATEVRIGGSSWETAATPAAFKGFSNSYTLVVTSGGTYTARIKHIDTTGNYSAAAASSSVVFTVTAPTIASLAASVVGPDLQLDFTGLEGSFFIAGYQISYGSTFAGSTPVGTFAQTRHTRRVDWGGARRWWVAAVDVAGNVGAGMSVDVTISPPGVVTSTRSEVVDNNALLYWAPPATGSLPFDRYEVRKGPAWLGGEVVGSNGNSTFTTIFEQQAGVYSYWVAAVDTAGTAGTAVAIVATVNQPPDYVLRADYNDDFSGITLSGLFLEGGRLYGPALNETIQTHFESRSWATPDAQIVAGYPLVFQPSGTSGYCERTIDYGAALPSTIIGVTVGSTVLSGAVAMVCQLSYKTLAGDSWTDAPSGDMQALASGFRYVKVRLTFTASGGDDLIEVASLNVKLSSKLKADSGAGSAVSTDVGGTSVSFTVAFIDVQSIVVTPSGTTARYAIYDFVDAPYPTSFKVLLFDSAGARVSGGFSWTARGF